MSRKFFNFNLDLMSDISHNKFFLIGTYTVLGLVSAFMTVMNVMTKQQEFLTICTASFAILCVTNIVLSVFGDRLRSFAKFLFAVEALMMFTFFLVSGNPEGFSVIWICMLPSLGMFFFDRFRGTILCAVMFLILVFFLWTPYGNGLLMYEYTGSFKMRFPILFVAFHVFAFFLETLRDNAYKETKRMQNYYHDLSLRDALTEVFNRQGLYSALNEAEYKNASELGAAIFDIDDFKKVNDTYGHDVGDDVLKRISTLMNSYLNAVVCRWGGEEFVAVFISDNVTPSILDSFIKTIQSQEFSADGETFHITVSVGYCKSTGADVKYIDRLISNADTALYHAKNNGKNQIIEYTDSMQMEHEASASV